MAAENYHLKWDSHLSYLNSSVATLYKNEKFADVVLYSSSNISGNGGSAENGIPTVGISAHKFILSSCSQFFATMFETAPISAPNGVLYVVLPPDLSHRAIQILVQYMYSGEATVSNDILTEVLRGGEILKIRGLCRTSSGHHHQNQRDTGNSAHYANGTRAMPPVTHTQLPNAHNNDIYGISKCAAVGNNCTSRYSIEHPQQFRGLGASVMPKDSPVIVKSPKMSQLNIMPTSGKPHTGISVNKEVAIDPEDKCCYPVNQHEQIPPVPIMSSASLCNEVGCNSCPVPPEASQLRRRQSDELPPTSLISVDRLESEYSEQSVDENCEREDIAMAYDRRLRRASGSERAREYFSAEHYDPVRSRLSSPAHQHNFLSIKQEPTDWSTQTVNENNSDLVIQSTSPIHSPKQPLDFKMPLGAAAVKMELSSSHSADEDEQSPHMNDYDFNRLPSVARTTNNSTNSTGDSLSKSYVPKKRRRISQQENSMDHVTLLCDLCSTSFETPAEWVRHMNNQHTEIELAMFNSKKDSEQKTTTSSSATTCSASSSSSHQTPAHKKYSNRSSLVGYTTEHSDRICDICNKKFSSHNNMLLHKRSHIANDNINSTPLCISPMPGGTGKTQNEQRSSLSTQ